MFDLLLIRFAKEFLFKKYQRNFDTSFFIENIT